MNDTAARGAPSISVRIIYSLRIENGADVSFIVQDTHHHDRVLTDEVVDAKLVESLYRPGTKAA